MTNTYNVWKRSGAVPYIAGVVKADNQVQADKKAIQIFGSGSWTKPKETGDEAA
jgi:hypothetical protein